MSEQQYHEQAQRDHEEIKAIISGYVEEQREWNRNCDKKLNKMERGLYGDEDNGQIGVIQTVKEHGARLTNIEKKILKIGAIAGGAWVAFEIIMKFV